jgi:hypothetical protein
MASSSGTQTVYNYTQNQLPEWYTNYLSGITGRANQYMDQELAQGPQVYGGQRVAGLTQDEQGAYQMVRDQQGNYVPYIDQSGNWVREGVNASETGAFAPYRDQATRLTEAGVNYDVLGGVDPILNSTLNTDFTNAAGSGDNYLNQGLGTALDGTTFLRSAGERNTAKTFDPYSQQAVNLAYRGTADTLGTSSPYVTQAANMNGLATASPYLSKAAGDFPSEAARYMSPYTSLVTDRIADLGARNLKEKLLPTISDDFIRAGQYGSTGQRDTVGKALRDTQEAVLGEQARSLESGYATAGNLYGQDAARYAGLAGTAGNLGLGQGNLSLNVGKTLADIQGSDLNRTLQASGQISDVGKFATQAQQEDASRLLQAGSQMGQIGLGIGGLGIQRGQLGLGAAQAQAGNARDIAQMRAGILENTAQRQFQGGQQMAGIGAQNAGFVGNDAGRRMQGATQYAGLGQQIQQQGLTGASAMENIGQTQRGLNQQNLDVAYGDYLEQRDQPWTTLGRAGSLVTGFQLPTSGTSQQQSRGGGPSTTAQVAGAVAGGIGLANSGLFRAKGGKVKKPKAVASYGKLPKRGLSMMMEAA